MELINTFLSGYIMPALLMGCGIIFGFKMRFFYIFQPKKVLSALRDGAEGGGVSPFQALSQALAGTLGVGNMTGVATAICAGGAGAVFWMWLSAILAMSVKYFEVALAIKHRRCSADGYFGGAMYYIKDIFSRKYKKAAPILGGAFALLCIINSLLTGNMVQMNSAAAVFTGIPPVATGIVCCTLALPVILGKGRRVSSVTGMLIPFLSAAYILISLIIIVPNFNHLPAVFTEIFKGAFSLRAAGGGIGGYIFLRAIRFGTTRGIFSNEAGSGTSPTAHAEANAKSPHTQGCFGIFEVFADTIVLCTLTALVILLSDGCALGMEGINLTLYAYTSLAGKVAGIAIGISAILFAYATLICQTHYGTVALRSITKSRSAYCFYICAVCAFCIFGTVVNDTAMWQAADFVISLMTALNVLCLVIAMRQGEMEGIIQNKIYR